MDYLWTPWRFQYVSEGTKSEACVFCEKASADPSNDREHLVLYRGKSNFILLNLYPYTVGHAMVVPYAHIGELTEATDETLSEMMFLAQQFQQALKDAYHRRAITWG